MSRFSARLATIYFRKYTRDRGQFGRAPWTLCWSIVMLYILLGYKKRICDRAFHAIMDVPHNGILLLWPDSYWIQDIRDFTGWMGARPICSALIARWWIEHSEDRCVMVERHQSRYHNCVLRGRTYLSFGWFSEDPGQPWLEVPNWLYGVAQ